jgi:pilus assembly protein CpaB
MKSRLIGGLLAAVLALAGALLTFMYAQGADARAMRDMEPVDVLVVTEEVPASTPIEDLPEFLAVESLPVAAVPAGALDSLESLDALSGQVTAVELLKGEVLLPRRLIDPAALQVPNTVPVPEGLQEVTFALDPQRVIGGRIIAGDTIGVFVSFVASEDQPDDFTQRVFHRTLVTSVQRAVDQPTEEGVAPSSGLMVTVAVGDVDAARIIYAAEYGSVWLTKEPESAIQEPPTAVTKENLFP